MEAHKNNSWLAACAAGFLTTFLDRITELGAVFEHFGASRNWVTLVLLSPAIVVLFSWLSSKASRISSISNVDEIDLEVLLPDQLLGREADLESLVRLCESPLVYLAGESGVGKSSLLKVGLAAQLEGVEDMHPVYIDSLGKDWESSPRAAIAKRLWSTLDQQERKRIGYATSITPDKVADALTKVKNKLKKTTILIFDQFEEYIMRHRTQLMSASLKTWISAHELTAENSFWKEMSNLMGGGCVRLLFGVRSDSVDGMHSFCFTETEVKRLQRIPRTALIQKLRQMTESGFAKNPENGWEKLSERLTADLSRRELRVLPVQMRIAFQGLLLLPRLTTQHYLALGGLSGLEAQVIKSEVESCARSCGLNAHQALSVLVSLVDERRRTTRARYVEDINKAICRKMSPGAAKVAEPKIAAALDYFEEKQIVRRQLDPDTDDQPWILYHDYLCRSILEAERQLNRWEVLLRDKYQAFSDVSWSLWKSWQNLLPPWQWLGLGYQRARRKLRFGLYRKYYYLSTLRFSAYVLPLVFVMLLADSGALFPGSSTIRSRMNLIGWSFFRDIHTPRSILSEAEIMQGSLLEIVEKRTTKEGWVKPQDKVEGRMPDYWAHPQALASLLNQAGSGARTGGPSAKGPNDEEIESLFGRLSLMFAPESLVVVDDRHYGWKPTPDFPYTRAEPLFWSGMSLASLYEIMTERRPEDPRRDLLLAWVAEAQKVAETYYHPASGGWNLFPNQAAPEANSTYAATLATMMLLDMKSAGCEFSVAGRDRDELILLTIKWLLEGYLYEAAVPGWVENPTSDEDGNGRYDEAPSEGLTLQVYSVLMRAAEDFPISSERNFAGPVLATIRKNIKTHLLHNLDDTSSTPQRIKTLFENHEGEMEKEDRSIEFLWYPWAIEAAVRGLQRADELALSPSEVVSLHQGLGHLTTDLGEKYMQDLRHTYKVSELVYSLGTLEKLLDE